MSEEAEEFLDDSPELFEHFRFEVDPGQSLLRIDKYLISRMQHATRNKLQQATANGNVLVNGKPVKSNYKVKPRDIITIELEHERKELELIAQDIPLNIPFEDDDLIIVNKDPGMVVHPAYGHYDGTLVNALIYHFQNLPINKSGGTVLENGVTAKHDVAAATRRPGLVHRIDKNTSGIMVIAKNDEAMTTLAKSFFDRDLDRIYYALVWGDFDDDEGTITGNIGRHLKDRKKMDVFAPESEIGKHAVTHYKVLERFGYVTLVECKLETGRTHQIRAHFKYIGHPLFNDETYGGNRILKGTTFSKYKQFVDNCFNILPRHALHAKSLGFKHPTSKEYIHFDSELPSDMAEVLEKWRGYAVSMAYQED